MAERRKVSGIDERRRMIVNETRELIAREGVDGVRVRDLAERCGIAVATIYNKFGSRDGAIAAALETDFRERFEPLSRRTKTMAPAEKLKRRMEASIKAVLKMRNYSRAVMSYYFVTGDNPTLRAAIHDFVHLDFAGIVDEIRALGDLQPWVDPRTFSDDLITQSYAITSQWAHGRIEDRELPMRMRRVMCANFIGITRGKTRKEFEALIASYKKIS